MLTETEKYINPLTDFGFKKLFGSEPNKDLLIDLLNQIIPDRKIAEVSYSMNEHFGKSEVDRKAIFDIYCIGDNGDHFIVEMQKAKQNFFKDRSVFYASFPIQEQAKKKNWNYQLDAIYSIGILDFVFDDHKTESTLYHLVELKDQRCEVFYEKLKFIYIELPKFKKGTFELESRLDKWLYVFRHLWNLSSRPEVLRESIFKKLFEVAEISKFNKAERKDYEGSLKIYRDIKNIVDTAREEGKERGIKKGKEQGIKEGKEQGIKEGKEQGIKEGIKEGKRQRNIEIAKALKAQGLSNEAIAQSTGLTIAEVDDL